MLKHFYLFLEVLILKTAIESPSHPCSCFLGISIIYVNLHILKSLYEYYTSIVLYGGWGITLSSL